MSAGRHRLLGLRGLRAQPRAALAVAAVVAVAAGVVALVPPVIARAQAEGLRHEAAQAPARERDLEVVQAGRIPAERLDGTVRARLGALPERLAATVGASHLVADTPRYVAERLAGSPAPAGLVRILTLRLHEGLEEHVDYVQGNPPAQTTDTVSVETRSDGRIDVPVLEIALSLRTAEALGVRAGDVLALRLVPDQPQLLRVSPFEESPVAVRVADFFGVRDARDPYWSGDQRVSRPIVQDTESARIVFAFAVVDRAAYADLLAATGRAPLTYRWRYGVDPARLHPADTGALARELRRLELRYGVVQEEGTPRAEARTGLARVLERFREQQRAAVTALSFAGGGFLGLALVVLVATAHAGGAEHRSALRLARDRGARRLDVRSAAAAAAAAVVGVAALVGVGAAAAGTGELSAAGVVAGLAVALVATLALATALLPPARPPSDPAVAVEAAERRGRRRAAVEAIVVALAVASVVSLRGREAPDRVFDPLAVVTPLLVLAALTLLALRLLPLLARSAAGLAARRPGLVPVVALRRAAREPRAAILLAAVGSIAVGVATFVALAGRGRAGEPGPRSPLLVRVDDLLALASGLGVAYAAAAILLVALVVGRSRALETSRLGAMGMSRPQAAGLSLVELVPAAAAGVLVGAGAGVLAYLAVEPVLVSSGGGSAVGAVPALAALVLLPGAAAAAALAAVRRPA
jgi:putative ABC transport system permease protein